jgi:3',5'-cyclic AMP phosphodiesterase CpdA
MNKFCVTLAFWCIILSNFAQAPTPNIHELSVNADKPGAVYSFSFVHLTDVHIGEGDGDRDYGSIGINDFAPDGDIGDPAIRLRNTVNWLKENHEAEQIKFVIVSGDLTDSGERSEYLKFKEIMDELPIPYIPLIGNHDVWPYTGAEQAEHPNGDSLINELFDSTFIFAQSVMDNWDEGTRLTRQFNPETNNYNYLQNYAFEYDGFHFLMLDFNPRYPAANNEPGIGPEAELMDFEGGSWDWMKQKIENLNHLEDQNLFIVSHHPPLKEIWSIWYAFDLEEKKSITDFLWNYKQHIAVWLAGHIHRSIIYHVNTSGLQPYEVFKSVETAANKEYEKGLFRKVDVYKSPLITNVINDNQNVLLAVYPNPSNGVFQLFIKDNHQKYVQAEVFDALGKSIFREQLSMDTYARIFTIDLKTPPKGIYNIRIELENRVITQNVIVQ